MKTNGLPTKIFCLGCATARNFKKLCYLCANVFTVFTARLILALSIDNFYIMYNLVIFIGTNYFVSWNDFHGV